MAVNKLYAGDIYCYNWIAIAARFWFINHIPLYRSDFNIYYEIAAIFIIIKAACGTASGLAGYGHPNALAFSAGRK